MLLVASSVTATSVAKQCPLRSSAAGRAPSFKKYAGERTAKADMWDERGDIFLNFFILFFYFLESTLL